MEHTYKLEGRVSTRELHDEVKLMGVSGVRADTMQSLTYSCHENGITTGHRITSVGNGVTIQAFPVGIISHVYNDLMDSHLNV